MGEGNEYACAAAYCIRAGGFFGAEKAVCHALDRRPFSVYFWRGSEYAMHHRSAQLMLRLIRKNALLFAGAGLCMLASVVIDYLTPLLLAETIDTYLSGAPSALPAFVNRWVDALGGPAYIGRHL